MEILDEETRERFNAKLESVHRAQRRARRHIRDADDTVLREALDQAEQGIADLKRMVA